MSNYRNRKLTESARHEACVSCGANDGTVVWAHSNSQKHGKGIGIKAHDLFGAYLCYRCHADYDAGKHLGIETENGFSFDNKLWFKEMWERSMIVACERGYLK
jgi:hypothetical protein